MDRLPKARSSRKGALSVLSTFGIFRENTTSKRKYTDLPNFCQHSRSILNPNFFTLLSMQRSKSNYSVEVGIISIELGSCLLHLRDMRIKLTKIADICKVDEDKWGYYKILIIIFCHNYWSLGLSFLRWFRITTIDLIISSLSIKIRVQSLGR